MKYYISTIMVLALLLVSCSKESEADKRDKVFLPIVPVENCTPHYTTACVEGANTVNIRVRNFSRYDLCNVEYTPYVNTINFGSINSGDSSCYVPVFTSYRYPSKISFLLGDTSFTLEAVDFVLEDLVENGNYNYNINLVQDDRVRSGGFYLTKEGSEIPFPQNPLENCDEHSLSDCGISQSKVNLRVVNHSVFDLCNVSYQNNNGEMINMGNLLAGEVSCYVPIENIFEYNYLFQCELSSISLVRDYLTVEPIMDDPIVEGNYTMHVTIWRLNQEGLALTLTKDD